MTDIIDRLERMLALSRKLSASPDLAPFLQTVASVAIDLTECEACSILGYDSEVKSLRFLAAPPAHMEALKSAVVPLDGSLAGLAFTSQAPVMARDAKKDQRHLKSIDQVTGFQTHTVLAVPIIFYGTALGVFEAVNKRNKADYTEDDVTILETLASQAAVALQNERLAGLVEKTREDMQRLDRMKSDFIAISSHELRTPLGLILGHSTFLREVIGEDHRSQLDTIIRNAMRLKEIIENMSNVDNFQSGMAVVRRRTVSVRRLIEDIVQSFDGEAKEKLVSLSADLVQADLLLEGDAEKIGIAIGNLVKNAIMFTNEGGHVFVVGEQIPGYVKVSVIDDGVGIPARDLPHIFERFFQVESHLTRKHGGMGLGLSVSKMMVEMHGGRIWVESAEGKGSNFTLLLPLDSSQAQAAQKVFLP
jgi:signal transduction histidine kinase